MTMIAATTRRDHRDRRRGASRRRLRRHGGCDAAVVAGRGPRLRAGGPPVPVQQLAYAYLATLRGAEEATPRSAITATTRSSPGCRVGSMSGKPELTASEPSS